MPSAFGDFVCCRNTVRKSRSQRAPLPRSEGVGREGCGGRQAREACRTEAAQKVGDGGRAQRSTEGRAGAERRSAKALCPASESCLAGRPLWIVDESSLMGARHCRKFNRGKGRAFALARASLPGARRSGKGWEESRDRSGAATGESLGMMVLPSRRRCACCAFEIHASPSAGVCLPAVRGRGNGSEQCRIRLLSMFRTGAECREKRRTRHRNAVLSASRVVFYPKIS